MQIFFDLLYWLFLRPWHIWVPLVLSSLVIFSALYWKKQAKIIYKISSMTMQFFGVLVLLFLLSQNVLTIKNTDFIAEIRRWANENPFQKTSQTFQVQGLEGKFEVGPIRLRLSSTGNTLEEKVSILEKQIIEIRREIDEDKQEIIKKINENKADSDNKIERININYGNLNKLLESVIVGDYRLPIFSTLLILAGLILSVFPIKSP